MGGTPQPWYPITTVTAETLEDGLKLGSTCEGKTELKEVDILYNKNTPNAPN